jgi:chromosome segregation ATPase
MKKQVARLEKQFEALALDVRDLKSAAWKTAEILADHSEQLSGLDRRLGSMEGKLGSMEGKLGSMEGKLGSMEGKLEAVVERLDRLIAVTIQERTFSTERLGDIERRLTRLEERVGV